MRFLLLAAFALSLAACQPDASPEAGVSEAGATDALPPSDAADLAASDTPVNLNTATVAEFEALPGVGARFAREFDEYRPYASILEFRRAIGKYVDADQVAAFEALVFVPIDINASDAATVAQLPGVDEATATTLIALRPFADDADFVAAVAEATGRAGDEVSMYLAR